MRAWLLVLIVLGPWVSASAAAPARDAVAGMKKFGGPEGARRKLFENGFVVTDETYRQISSFYVHRKPSFITTDSVLHAYLLNLEKALQKLEKTQAERLCRTLDDGISALMRRCRKGLEPRVKKGALEPAWRDAATAVVQYLQVAHALARGRTGDAELQKLPEKVAAEVRLIMSAGQRTASPLRGVPIDYLRFKPRGLYLGDASLERFYRAMTWLHEVPFRTADEHETRQAVLLATRTHGGGTTDWHGFAYAFGGLASPYARFLGPSDDLGLEDYKKICDKHLGSFFPDERYTKARWVRTWQALRALPAPRHTTIVTVGAVCKPSLYKGLRLLPRPSLYDNDLLAPLTPFGKTRPLVSGEELMAVMGSKVARAIVTGREGKQVADYETLFSKALGAVPDAEKRSSGGICLARRAVYRALLEEPTDASLPAYIRHPAWRYKDLNTCLAGWAHHRYIWDLHGKRRVYYSGFDFWPPGVVEPNRRFFIRLLDLTVLTDAFFRRYGVEHATFGRLAELLVALRVILDAQLAGRSLTTEQKETLQHYGMRLGHICGFEGDSWMDDTDLPDTAFCVPIAIDLNGSRERVVGQSRPRAIYVIAEHKGKRFLATGGVLSYRDHVGPAQGPERMTVERWRKSVASGRVAPPAWRGQFAASYAPDALLADLRKGLLREQTFRLAGRAVGDILAEKLAKGDPFTVYGERAKQGRRQAIRLFAETNHPKVVGVLFPMLVKGGDDAWPVAHVLDGRLNETHAPELKRLLDAGKGDASLLVGRLARIPGQRAEDLTFACMDRFAANPQKKADYWCDNRVSAAAGGVLERPGLSASRRLAKRLDTYKGRALESVLEALERKWLSPRYDARSGRPRARSVSKEEAAFVKALEPRIVKLLLDILKDPNCRPYGDYWVRWVHGHVLEGRLTETHAVEMGKWLVRGYPLPHVLIALLATIPGARAEDIALAALDRMAASPDNTWAKHHGYRSHFTLETAIEWMAKRKPGLGVTRKLMKRLDTYKDPALGFLVQALSKRWSDTYLDWKTETRRPRVFTPEEAALVKELRARIERAKARP